MVKPKVNVTEVVAGIKDNLKALRTIKSEDMTEKERVKFSKDLDELEAMALKIKKDSK